MVEEREALAAGLRPGGLDDGFQLKELKSGAYALDVLVDLGAAETRTKMTTTAILFHKGVLLNN